MCSQLVSPLVAGLLVEDHVGKLANSSQCFAPSGKCSCSPRAPKCHYGPCTLGHQTSGGPWGGFFALCIPSIPGVLGEGGVFQKNESVRGDINEGVKERGCGQEGHEGVSPAPKALPTGHLMKSRESDIDAGLAGWVSGWRRTRLLGSI